MPWYRGHTHTHTTASDGDSPLNEVAAWYRDHDYQFLAITDHFKAFDASTAPDLQDENFILLSGQEVSDLCGNMPVHVNAFGVTETLKETGGRTVAETIQNNVNNILKAGGIPALNHPSFHYAFAHRELLDTNGYVLFELQNCHPEVYNAGDAAHLSTEQTWDIVLSEGKRLFGIASDDMHHLKGFSRERANPGRGWIVVHAKHLTEKDILAAMVGGDFYASTGVTLGAIEADKKAFHVEVDAGKKEEFLIRFVGTHGRILSETITRTAAYTYKGGEGEKYVRAKIIAKDGTVAWTQPRFV